MKKIYIVILNFNGEKFIINCLKSVNELLAGDYEINTIVVDNASTDKSVQLISEKFPKIKILVNKENLGFAEGNNIGIRYALNNGADYILLLNNDTIVDKKLVTSLIGEALESSEIGLISPKIYFAPGYEFHKDHYKEKDRGQVIWYAGGLIDWKNMLASHKGVDEVDRGQFNQTIETDFTTGCCLLITREVFKKIGFFDKKYFLYFEDTDFNIRAKRSGFKIIYCPKGVIWHLNAGSSGSGSQLHDYYLTRNRLLFGFKYASFKVKLLLLKESIKDLFESNSIKKKAFLDFLLGNFNKQI